MLKLIFENKKKINKLGKQLRKGKQTELFLIVVGMYLLSKLTINNGVEICNLKKAIEELKSKGE